MNKIGLKEYGVAEAMARQRRETAREVAEAVPRRARIQGS